MVERSWQCAQLDLLTRMASLAIELSRIQLELLPNVTDDVVESLLLMKNAAMNVARLGKSVKKMKVLYDRVTELSDTILSDANMVLGGARDTAWLQERLPYLLDHVNAVSTIPIRFAVKGK